MIKAYSPKQILQKKFKTLAWSERWVSAFGNPEASGTWFIYGESTNGKTSFTMQLLQELASLGLGKVYLNSLEEGTRKTMQDNITRSGLAAKNNILIGCEDMDSLDERLSKRKSPWAVIIDSVQFTNMRTARFAKLKEKHKNKLIIYISHVEKKQPKGSTAKDIRYHADLKIWVEGFRAKSQGRYNAGGIYTIWEEEANKYWGQTTETTQAK